MTTQRRLHVAIASLFAANLFIASQAAAQASSADMVDEQRAARARTQDWSLGAAMHSGPFESYPHFGLSTDASYCLGRWRLGGNFVFYVPESYGNVRRIALLLNANTRLIIVHSRYLEWYAALGLGLGVFRDNYHQVFDDVTRLAPGFTLGTGLAFRATPLLRPFLGFRAASYFAEDVVDDKWLELMFGVRFAVGPSR